MSDGWSANDKTDEDAGNRTASHELIPKNHVMESVPFLRFDPSDDTILLPLLRDSLTTSDGHQEAILGTLLIGRVWDLACLLPFFAVPYKVLYSHSQHNNSMIKHLLAHIFGPFPDVVAKLDVTFIVVW